MPPGARVLSPGSPTALASGCFWLRAGVPAMLGLQLGPAVRARPRLRGGPGGWTGGGREALALPAAPTLGTRDRSTAMRSVGEGGGWWQVGTGREIFRHGPGHNAASDGSKRGVGVTGMEHSHCMHARVGRCSGVLPTPISARTHHRVEADFSRPICARAHQASAPRN